MKDAVFRIFLSSGMFATATSDESMEFDTYEIFKQLSRLKLDLCNGSGVHISYVILSYFIRIFIVSPPVDFGFAVPARITENSADTNCHWTS